MTIVIPGPYPFSIRRTGTGVRIGTDRLVWELLAGLAKQYAEDPAGVGEDLTRIAVATGGERDRLLEDLTAELGDADAPFSGPAARQMAEALKVLAGPVPVPAQGVAA
ncbi:MAG: hypothetical protein HOZ81_50425 [Streptomyces sp.]|nr:hypothetical protein [Streptomyces sp.]NUS24391.1 hypothetical protein [Streptomyces sp.]